MSELAHPARADIDSKQLEQLRSLVAELFPGNKFYSAKLNASGITFDISSLEDYRYRFPFTTKQELIENQLATPPFGTNLTYPLNGYTRYHQTSGTTGQPLRWLDTPESWDAMVEHWAEVLRVAGASPGDRIYFPFSFGPFIGFWLAFESAERLGCLCIPGGGLSSTARLRAILDNGVTMLCCTPTYAIRLAEVAAEEKIDLRNSRVRTMVVAGEAGGSIPSTRARIASLWPRARIFDHHGMTEVGPVTYECPSRPGVLHVLESAHLPEIIDPSTGKPVGPGETGELVLTTLQRVGSPLLRYRTGDLVKRAADKNAAGPKPKQASQCACGRYDMALEGGILGRTDEMVVVRGVNVFPSAIEDIVRGCDGVAEYRAHITTVRSLLELSLQIEPRMDCPDAADLARTLEGRFETALSLRVPVTVVASGSLPRFEMKSKRWVREGA
jgi:phenylacetate-CoA ligase